jgi:hypothetical protein
MPMRQTRGFRSEADPGTCAPPAFTGRNDCGHHEGDRLAVAFGVRLPGRVVRKSLGLTLASEKTGEERIYRVAAKGKAAKRKE